MSVIGEVYKARREAHRAEGTLAATVREAMRLWDVQKADGLSRAERLAGLERTIRAAWPFTREWKYLHEDCLDLGIVMHTCDGDDSCGRHFAHLPHVYGRPCWCSLGAKFRGKPKPSGDDFTQAGKSKPTRVGR